ncbi:hypothetical protein D082_10540 [Synechocystis sp. PCC 6714]|nr:hypothetical protein D082_10540 [Synechocystis sp. PCC 6714]
MDLHKESALVHGIYANAKEREISSIFSSHHSFKSPLQ